MRPLVVFLFDARNWSLHRIALQLQRQLGERYEILIGTYRMFENGAIVPISRLRSIATLVCLWHGDAPQAFARVPPWTRRVLCVYDCGIYWGRALEEAAVSADVVGYVSPPIRRALLESWPHLEKKIQPCYDGVDSTALFTPVPWPLGHKTAKRLKIGWCGSLDVHGGLLKGVDLIRQAAQAASDWLTLVIADRTVKFERMRDCFYAKIDVYVCMSMEEGTPNPLLEAAACGRPFVSSNVGIASLFLADARRHIEETSGGSNTNDNHPPPGIVLPTRDAALLVQELHAYHLNRNLLQKAGAAARRTIERGNWDWSSRAKQFANALLQ